MVNNLIGTFNKKVEIYNLPQQHKLIISCLPMLQALSVKIARKTGYSSEDLFQESVLGLLKAIQLINVTGPIGPESPLLYKSQPSSTLL